MKTILTVLTLVGILSTIALQDASARTNGNPIPPTTGPTFPEPIDPFGPIGPYDPIGPGQNN